MVVDALARYKHKEMPDLDCDTLDLATLRTAASIGQDDSLILIGRSQGDARIDRCGHCAGPRRRRLS